MSSSTYGGVCFEHVFNTHPGSYNLHVGNNNESLSRTDMQKQKKNKKTDSLTRINTQVRLAREDVPMCFGLLVQTHHCDRIRKSLIRPDLFTLFLNEKTHLESP